MAETEFQEAPPSEGIGSTLSATEKIAYGLGDTASNFYWKTTEYFLVYYYTDVFGLTAGVTATLMLLTRVWDAVNDPLMGYLSDRTRTRWGRFRPYLLWMSVPLAISGMLTFYTPDLAPTQKVVYAAVTYTLMLMAYTAVNGPYGALMAVITPDSLERTSVATYRFVAAYAGGVLVQIGFVAMVQWFGRRPVFGQAGSLGGEVDERVGFFWTMVVFATLSVVLFWICFWATRERVDARRRQAWTFSADLRFLVGSARLHQVALVSLLLITAFSFRFAGDVLIKLAVGYVALSLVSLLVCRLVGPGNCRSNSNVEARSSLQSDLSDLSRNGPWITLSLFSLLLLTAGFIRSGATVFYFKYYCGDASLVATFLVCGSVASITGMLWAKRLAARFGKKKLMIGIHLICAALLVPFYYLKPDQTAAMIALQITTSMIWGPAPVLLWAMYADTADYSQWRNQRRATGMIFSAATFAQKLGCSIGAAMTGFVLDFYGYVPPKDGVQVVQSEETLAGIRIMMSYLPAMLYLAGSGILVKYSIDSRMLVKIANQLRGRQVDPDS